MHVRGFRVFRDIFHLGSLAGGDPPKLQRISSQRMRTPSPRYLLSSPTIRQDRKGSLA